MPEERADFIRSFGRQDVLKLASLLLDFRFAIHGQRVGEEALRETMTPDNVGGPLLSTWRQFDDRRTIARRNPGWL